MAFGKNITLYLMDGAPDGRIACDLHNWTGKAFKIPRKWLKDCSDRQDVKNAGVYFLFGRTKDSSEINKVYIGEGENAYKRIAEHLSEGEDVWTEVLFFVSKDENLNKAHVKFLENLSYVTAGELNRCKVTNPTTPTCPAISEAEQAVLEEFFENMKILAGTLGYKLFQPLHHGGKPTSEQYFIKAARGADATAIFTDEGMVVKQGSKASGSTVESATGTVLNTRDKLISEGVLQQDNTWYVFTKDHLFSSPSTAACVVMGRNANGLTEWKDATGQTLKDNQQ